MHACSRVALAAELTLLKKWAAHDGGIFNLARAARPPSGGGEGDQAKYST